jgi:Flp pilus assembly protein TadG
MFKNLRFRPRLNSKKGNSLIEFIFVVPWYVFLFTGSFDCGIYSYALVVTQEGARMAAVNASQNSSLAANAGAACTYVIGSLQGLPNMSGVNACGTAPIPINVTATYGLATGPDGGPMTTVTATYTTPQLIPIPGLPGQLTITKTVKMRVRG